MKSIQEENDPSIRLHTNSCDKLYRWSMWRMYLNEELSRVISSRCDFSDQSKSVNKVTSPYLRHRDGVKYGHQMKRLFQRNLNNSSRSLDILPDNVYLVYGLPRASINNVPDEVRKLHKSVKPRSTYCEQKDASSSSEATDAGEQITKMFEFVTSDFTKGDVSQLTFRKLGKNKTEIQNGSSKSRDQEINRTTRRKIFLPGEDSAESKSEVETVKSDKDVPLVSKSRLFWEKLASKKSDIIEMKNSKEQVNGVNRHQPQPDTNKMVEIKGKVDHMTDANDHKPQYFIPPPPALPQTKQTTQAAGISNDILQKQQGLLKKTVPKRTSKDLWRSLADRKTEILQLREMNGKDNPNPIKKHESKTSQLWSFLFAKKKELVQMKQGNQEATKGQERGKKNNVSKENTRSTAIPNNFEDNFQRELAEKLRKRRERDVPIESSNL